MNVPRWTPWSEAQWNAWLEKSKQLVAQLAALDGEGKRDERDAVSVGFVVSIDAINPVRCIPVDDATQ